MPASPTSSPTHRPRSPLSRTNCRASSATKQGPGVIRTEPSPAPVCHPGSSSALEQAASIRAKGRAARAGLPGGPPARIGPHHGGGRPESTASRSGKQRKPGHAEWGSAPAKQWLSSRHRPYPRAAKGRSMHQPTEPGSSWSRRQPPFLKTSDYGTCSECPALAPSLVKAWRAIAIEGRFVPGTRERCSRPCAR